MPKQVFHAPIPTGPAPGSGGQPCTAQNECMKSPRCQHYGLCRLAEAVQKLGAKQT